MVQARQDILLYSAAFLTKHNYMNSRNNVPFKIMLIRTPLLFTPLLLKMSQCAPPASITTPSNKGFRVQLYCS